MSQPPIGPLLPRQFRHLQLLARLEVLLGVVVHCCLLLLIHSCCPAPLSSGSFLSARITLKDMGCLGVHYVQCPQLRGCLLPCLLASWCPRETGVARAYNGSL